MLLVKSDCVCVPYACIPTVFVAEAQRACLWCTNWCASTWEHLNA